MSLSVSEGNMRIMDTKFTKNMSSLHLIWLLQIAKIAGQQLIITDYSVQLQLRNFYFPLWHFFVLKGGDQGTTSTKN